MPQRTVRVEAQLNVNAAAVDSAAALWRLWFEQAVPPVCGPVLADLATAPPLKLIAYRDEPIRPGEMSGRVAVERRIDGKLRKSTKAYSDKEFHRFLGMLDDSVEHADVSIFHEDTGVGARVEISAIFDDHAFAILGCRVPVAWLDIDGYERELLDVVRLVAHEAGPLYGQIGFERGSYSTALEEALLINSPDTVAGTTEVLRGYDWVTILSESAGRKLGGVEALSATGAFSEVTHLRNGGFFLVATETCAEYDQSAADAVFDVVAPCLPAGMPHQQEPDALGPPLYVAMRDAGQHPAHG